MSGSEKVEWSKLTLMMQNIKGEEISHAAEQVPQVVNSKPASYLNVKQWPRFTRPNRFKGVSKSISWSDNQSVLII